MCDEPLMQRQEAIADLRVNIVAFCEPMSLPQFFEPKADDFADPSRFDIFSFRTDASPHFCTV